MHKATLHVYTLITTRVCRGQENIPKISAGHVCSYHKLKVLCILTTQVIKYNLSLLTSPMYTDMCKKGVHVCVCVQERIKHMW